ncbi:MAG: hypothetical protein E7406_02885 [Ruminococcaceae bacterium]|nr:hypothetical protein [Oscillospiraceae bacterium]
MKTILFQGDSITDALRNKDNGEDLGKGYAFLVSAELGFENPGEYEFVNRGISGNRIVDVYARIKKDIINLKPDVMSLLIGVNDVWHEINYQNGVAPKKYKKIYSMLIEEVKEALPDIKIMILEPFVLEGFGTKENMDKFAEVKEMAKAAKEIAEEHNLVFVPLQDKFDAATKLAPPEYWLGDGVHPTPKGHELIKREWLKAFELL